MSDYSSIMSCVCCSSTSRPLSVETLLYLLLISHNLHDAYNPQNDGWHGPTKTCNLVLGTVPKAKTAL